MLEDLLHRVPVFVLVFFRLAGMMLMAPLFGSSRIPRRVKVLLVLVLAFGVAGGVKFPGRFPDTTWELAVGIGGEMAFGVAMGMVMSFTFIAAQWAGEMIGQQMGFNLSEVFDPQFGSQGSLIGDMYFMLTLVVFLTMRGHHAMLMAVRQSFDALPLLSLGVDKPLLDMLVGLLQSATTLALRLAAPMLVTMLVVDLALGLVGRAMPQFNVMQAGMSVRAVVGMVVVIAALGFTMPVITGAIGQSMDTVYKAWTTPAGQAAATG
jgi:flagellar biosynthetic protein FliR